MVGWIGSPRVACECGAQLGGAADLGVSDRYQQTEIPLVSATNIQYEQHTVRCGCGKVHTAARPEGAGPAGSATARTFGRGVCI